MFTLTEICNLAAIAFAVKESKKSNSINMNDFLSFSVSLFCGQPRMLKRVTSALVIFSLVLGRTNNVLQGLQLGSIHHKIILFKYFFPCQIYVQFRFITYRRCRELC